MRWPAEWEPHRATWLAWPHNPETWPGQLEAARAEFVAILRELGRVEPVELLVADEATEADVRRRLANAGAEERALPRFHHLPCDDSWLRDTAPIFVEDDDGSPLALDFDFDSWGGKYPPWDLDAALGRRIAAAAGLPQRQPGFVLEGGSVDGDGAGTLLTTESCLLHPNRESPPRTRQQMDERLGRWLGARRVIWLAEGIAGDDTDGHVDDIARFVAPGVVVAARADSGPDGSVLAENRRRLVAAGLEVHDLPMPSARSGAAHPASYANFLLANGVALVPVFGVAEDERALDVLRELLPARRVVGLLCRTLITGLGAIHCLSQQEPRFGASA